LQKNLYFLLNAGTGIPEPVGDGDEIQLLISVGYG